MKNTTKPFSLVTRRQTLRWLGAASAAALIGRRTNLFDGWIASAQAASKPAAFAEPSVLTDFLQEALFAGKRIAPIDMSQITCSTKPALTEGPFFVDELLNRSDIRPDPSNGTTKAGAQLKMKFTIGTVANNACTPLAGAFVDLWHCDATGGYSDVSGQGNPNNLGQKFLRGYQVTDSNGQVEFTTVYPGWYQGRTVHTHYKVRMFAGTTRTYEFTSQQMFDDAFTDQVYQTAPYSARPNRSTRNSNDNIYQQGGSSLLLNVASDGAGGYTTEYVVGVANVPTGVTGISAGSAASYAATLAPLSIGALFGANLTTSTASATSTTLPTELGGVQVFVRDALNTTRNAGLFFVSPSQINFQLPSGTAAGTAFIYVRRTSDNTVTGQGTVAVASLAPGLFTANANGQGVPAAVILRVKADGSSSFESLLQASGSTFVPLPIDLGAATDQVYFVGFGTGIRNRSSLSGVIATIGGTNATVSFAGAQGTLTGLDQVNVLIPRSLIGRGNVNLALTVDGKPSNTVTINVK